MFERRCRPFCRYLAAVHAEMTGPARRQCRQGIGTCSRQRSGEPARLRGPRALRYCRGLATAPPPDEIIICYDLFDLPTAQHKAGLAGLVLQIRSMTDRKLPNESIPVIEELTPTTAKVRFTAKSVQGLFDDVYDAQTVQVPVKSRWPNTPRKREDQIEEVEEAEDGTKKVKKVKRFIYDVTQQAGHFLRQHLPEMNRSA